MSLYTLGIGKLITFSQVNDSLELPMCWRNEEFLTEEYSLVSTWIICARSNNKYCLISFILHTFEGCLKFFFIYNLHNILMYRPLIKPLCRWKYLHGLKRSAEKKQSPKKTVVALAETIKVSLPPLREWLSLLQERCSRRRWNNNVHCWYLTAWQGVGTKAWDRHVTKTPLSFCSEDVAFDN